MKNPIEAKTQMIIEQLIELEAMIFDEKVDCNKESVDFAVDKKMSKADFTMESRAQLYRLQGYAGFNKA